MVKADSQGREWQPASAEISDGGARQTRRARLPAKETGPGLRRRQALKLALPLSNLRALSDKTKDQTGT